MNTNQDFFATATDSEKEFLDSMMKQGHNANIVIGMMQASSDDLSKMQILISSILAFRMPKDLIKIEWEGTVQDIRKGKPYFAILLNVNGKIEYKFVSTISYESKKANSSATAVFTGELAIGTVVRHRDGASWKNDYSEYSEITADGMKQITEIEAKRLLGIIK